MNYARLTPLILSNLNRHRLVPDTLAFLQHQAMLHGRILENRVLTDLPNIRVDANQLSQVLVNAVLNLAQATPEGVLRTLPASSILTQARVEQGGAFWRATSATPAREPVGRCWKGNSRVQELESSGKLSEMTASPEEIFW